MVGGMRWPISQYMYTCTRTHTVRVFVCVWCPPLSDLWIRATGLAGWSEGAGAACLSALGSTLLFPNYDIPLGMSIFGPNLEMEMSAEAFFDSADISKEEEEILLKDTADELPAPPGETEFSVPMEGVESSESVLVSVTARSKNSLKRQRQRENRRARLLASNPGVSLETPTTSRAGGSKRALSSASPATENRERNPPAPKKLFVVAAMSSLRLQVTFSDLEKGGLSVADFSSFKSALEGRIFSCNGNPRVRVENCSLVGGVGEILCHDETTVNWIHGQVGSLLEGVYKSWKDGELPPPKPKPKLHKFWCWLGGATAPDPKSFFTGLAVQNDLVTSQWRLNAAVGRAGGHTLILAVDEESLGGLEALDFRPYYGINRLLFQKYGSSRSGNGKGAVEGEGAKPP